ncbi:MAG: ribonuclease P protein subunit [Promethearchaeota archaeon]
MISPKYLIYHDLIGFEVLVKPKWKKNQDLFQNIGIVIDETKNMLITKKDNKIKKYIKKDHIFRFILPNGMLEVDGLKIVGIPENRLRILKKKRRLRR